jgi:hypothetical protein
MATLSVQLMNMSGKFRVLQRRSAPKVFLNHVLQHSQELAPECKSNVWEPAYLCRSYVVDVQATAGAVVWFRQTQHFVSLST